MNNIGRDNAAAIRRKKLSWLGSSCIGLLAFAAPALAQSAPPDSADALDEIVVTGFRGSIYAALEAKRNDPRVTDGISSEDLGKFPSENIAEAIQRISGVQISNVNGRGATISVRGLGPQYALTTINGQVFKSADFTDGFRYDIIQTELASSIQVIKSPTADLDSGGLSGTVNIETAKPLDYKSREFVVSATGQNSEFAGNKITPKVGISYVDQLLDGKLGVYLNVGYQKLEDRADYFWMDRWTTRNINGSTVTLPRRPRYRRIDRDTERKQASGGLQWRPTDSIEINATAIFARDSEDYDLNQQVFLFNTARLTANRIVNNTSVNTTATNFTLENNRQKEDRNLTSQGYTLSGKWTGEDGWVAKSALNYTQGKSYQREAAAILGINIPSATIDIADRNAIRFTVSPDLTDPGIYAASLLNRNEYPNGATRRVKSDELSEQFDLSKDVALGPISKLSAGVKNRHESFDRYITRHDLIALPNAPGANSSVFPSLPSNFYSVTGFLNGRFDIPDAWVGPDSAAYDRALAAAGIIVPEIFAPEGSYTVDRYIPSTYAMASIDTSVADVAVTGNIGLRYEYTRQRVKGNITAPRTDGYDEVQADVGDYTQTQHYDNFLPSFNLSVEPTDKLLIRFAAAKVLVRPILDSNTSLAQTTSRAVNPQNPATNVVTVDLGQSNLKPLTAYQADLGAEWYYSRNGALAINGFKKWIKNGTFSSLVCPGSFAGTALTNNGNDCVDTSGNVYDITQTLNDPATIRLKGFELSWNQSFDDFLPVDGFGFIGNFTKIYPQKVAIGTGFTVRNLSKTSWNATPYWENDNLSFRVAINHRSSYDQNSADSFFAREGHTVRARTQVDLSAGYTFDDHLSFSLGVINLNESKEEAYYNNDPSIWQESSFYGRSYYLTASWKL